MIKVKLRAAMALLPLAVIASPAVASETTAEQVIVPTPPPGKAEVVFYRTGGYAGSAISCAVAENGVKVSSLPPARFFILVADAGHHVYSVSSEAKDQIFFELKPGQISYVKCGVQFGFMVGRPKLEATIDEEFTTKAWKSVEKSRMGPGVLTDGQIKSALAMQTTAAPDAAPATAATPIQPAAAMPAVTTPAAPVPATATTIPAVATTAPVASPAAPASKH